MLPKRLIVNTFASYVKNFTRKKHHIDSTDSFVARKAIPENGILQKKIFKQEGF